MLERFITRDSHKYVNFKDPQTLDLYSYCGNNPVSFTDSTGRFEASDFDANGNFIYGPEAYGFINELGIEWNEATTQQAKDAIHALADDVRAYYANQNSESGTVGIGVSATGGCGGGGSVQVLPIVADTSGNVGTTWSISGGGYGGVGIGIGPVAQVTNAHSVDSLAGPSGIAGGSAPICPGASVSGEGIIGNGYYGGDLSLQVGPGTPSMYGMYGSTGSVTWFDWANPQPAW